MARSALLALKLRAAAAAAMAAVPPMGAELSCPATPD